MCVNVNQKATNQFFDLSLVTLNPYLLSRKQITQVQTIQISFLLVRPLRT